MSSSLPISVTNLVNLSNLERVFGEIYDKISTITTRVDKLESDLSSTVSLSRFLSHTNEYESNINLFESRIKYLEESMSSLKPIISTSSNNSTNIDKIRQENKTFITNEIFDEALNEFKLNIENKIENISSNKCSNDRIKKLEESTKDVCSQISAMESLLQCKVDKSQVPLIQSCQKQLDSLETFRDQISKRVCILDDQMSDISNDLNDKINTSTFDEVQNEFNELVRKKVDMSFLNEEVIKRLNTLLPDLLVLLQEHKQISTSKCFDEIKILQKLLNEEISNKVSINENNIDSILKQLYNVPSLQQMDIKADKVFCENLSNECKTYCKNNANNLQIEINEAIKQIDKLKVISNSLTEKTKVALRFVDWYSSLQLET